MRASLRQLEGYEVENVRDRELLEPAPRAGDRRRRVKGLTDIGRRFTPVGYVDGVRKKFIYAGDGSRRRRRPLPRHPGRHHRGRHRRCAPDLVDRAASPATSRLAVVVLVRPAAGPRPRRLAQPPGRGPPARDPPPAARRPRPAHDLGGGRPRLRAGARPHGRRGARARCPTSSPACSARSGPAPAAPRPCEAMETRSNVHRAPLLRARHPPGRHLRRVDRPGAAGPGRRDAHPSAASSPRRRRRRRRSRC